DAGSGTLYFGDGSGRIESVRADGTNQTTLFTVTSGSFFKLNFDQTAARIYWLDQINSYGASARLDGSNQQNFVTGTPGSQAFRALGVDQADGFTFWSNTSAHTVVRAGLDGSNPITIATGLDNVTGIAVDSAHGKVYFGENSLGAIYEANLDGSGLT